VDKRRQIVEGISAIAAALAELGCDEATARSDIIEMLRLADALDAEVVDEAVAQLSVEPPLPVGAPGAPARINAQLEAREWLQRRAVELRAGR
jgi:hypothetical protein